MTAGLILLCWLVFHAAAIDAGTAAPQLEADGAAQVAEVIDGDTVVLADGRAVRLVGIQAPKLPLGRPEFVPWPLADQAKSALAQATLGRTVKLEFGGRRMDRHGRLLAHLFAEDGTWIQGQVLERGLARVYTFADNRALASDMLALERTAREARRGLWRHPFYAVRSPENAARDIGTFQLVEGRVLAVAEVRGRTYANFGADWRRDFTLTFESGVRRLFESQGIDPTSYERRRIRVRGWLESWNGPMIEVTHPEQIEVLDE
jgi:micrococcal nuclease